MKIPKSNWSKKFIELMYNRCCMGFFRYGSAAENSKTTKMLSNAEIRIREYKKTGNTEFLVDASNFLMFEFMYPKHKKAHFKATSHEESPGIVGFAPNKLVEEIENKIYKHEGN